MDARLFLSKKGDIDLLLESLVDLEEEEFLAADDNGFPTDGLETLEVLQTRKRDLIQRLEEAEEELLSLWEKLPDRQVTIPDDQLQSSIDEEMPSSDVENQEALELQDLDENSEENKRLIPCGQRHKFRQILDSVTSDISIRPNVLVNAYLLHQLRLLPEEQVTYAEAIQVAIESTGVPLQTDLKYYMLSDWFEDVPRSRSNSKRSKSARRWTSGQNKTSLAMHSNQTQVIHGQSEPHMLRDPRRSQSGATAAHPSPPAPWKPTLNDRALLG